MTDKKQTVKLEIVATGHKVKEEDSLLVLIDPLFADWAENIYHALQNLTGHPRHAVVPIPKDGIKLFSVQHPITVSVNPSRLNPVQPTEQPEEATPTTESEQ